YQSRAVAAEAGTDPCGNDPTAIQQVHCAANGVPAGAYVQEEEAIATLLGGNADLGPEQGRSLGAGVTWAPAWARALTATVDVFDIELTDFIGRANLSEVLLECAERGAAAVCDTISRFPDGSVSRVSLEARNFGRLETRGVDLSVDVRSRAGAAHVNGRLLATYLARWDDQPFPGGEVFQRAGQLRFHDLPRVLPRWRASGHLDWQSGRWTASYSAEYIGSFAECGDGGIFLLETDCRRVASEILHDIEGGYAFDSGFALRAGLTNLTDEDPPFVNNHLEASTDPGTYRMLGRTYFLQLRYALR
ncbi:MAG: TonB-dependent receptor domain-containing protein, partial [Steroidobacteraceae bacterium]